MKPTHWEFLKWYNKTFGFFSLPYVYIKYLISQDFIKVSNPISKEKIYIRPGTADIPVFNDIFLHNELDTVVDNPKFIVDAGAHIGFASIWYAIKYPNATIIALEPEKRNFQMLLKNTEKYQNIIPINIALWNKNTFLKIESRKVENWAFQVKEIAGKSDIKAKTIIDLMVDYQINQIDILKMDIEGSEIEVFSNSDQWINSVRTIIIELHDRFRPGCFAALENALTKAESKFEISKSGEKVVLKKVKS
jgi:FkbM family methyltransferase